MAKSCKYYKQQRQVSYDNGVTWINLEEYRQGALIEVNSSDCTSPSTRIYRWVKASTDDYVCVGYDKHYKEYYQYSTDNGATWQNVVPTSSRTSNDVIEYNSVDCGVTPQYIYRWVKTDITTCVENTDFKFKANYSNGTTYSAACDSEAYLNSATTKPSGYQYTAMTSAEIGDCVTSIGQNVFSNCYSLTSITIPDSVIYIYDKSFTNCSILSRINSDVDGVFNLPSNLTWIGSNDFENCTSLTSVTIPESVTSIGGNAFYQCSGLTSITIPSGVTNLGRSAFEYCTSLQSITINATTPPTLYNTSVFLNTNSCPIYVPANSVNAYKQAPNYPSSRIFAIP